MIIKKMKIGDIQVAEYNPRIDLQPKDTEYIKLKRSIEEFDLVEPLIVNKRNNRLIGGHQRLKILQERGDTEVQVSIVDLDEHKEKILNIALNKISGDWDQQKLTLLFAELTELAGMEDLPDFDIELTGFDIQDIIPPDFGPGNEDNQGRLGELDKKSFMCPGCGHVIPLCKECGYESDIKD